MRVAEINPYIRYARYMNLDENSRYHQAVPLDARLFYTVKGQGKIKVKGVQYDMTPHSLLIVNAGVPYHLKTSDAPVEYIALNFDYSQQAAHRNVPVAPVSPRAFKREMLLDLHTFDDAPALSDVLYVKEFSTVQPKLSAILEEYTRRILYYENKCGHLLAECLFDCLRFAETGNYGVKKSSVSHILSYIHAEYPQNLTNAGIGKRFGYHPNYINFVIKRVTGMSLRQYLIHIRLLHAADLLESGALSVGEAAEQCGFCDAAYFSKCFKKKYGINPSEYKSRV